MRRHWFGQAMLVLLIAGLCAAVFSVMARAADSTPPPFTEIEALRVQNVNLEGQIVQRAVADWQAKVARLKADLEQSRPGWTWTPETGAWAQKAGK